MKTEDITTWLDSVNQDWNEGLALFIAFGNNKHMSRVLVSKGKNARTTRLLKYELTRILRASPPFPSKTQRQIGSKSITTSHPVNPFKISLKTSSKIPKPTVGEQNSDPVLAQLEAKKKAMFVEAASLFYQLPYQSKPMCEISCLRILKMWKDNRSIWKQIDYYKKYKFLPPAQDISTQLKLSQRLHTLRSYISKHTRQIASAKTEATRFKYQTKLNEYIAERNDIEFKLST
ncbi:MAG: hypothetical protein M0Q51_06530 [Bacteroidales bacterium]|nr:hypothetical protein [Bacteroidales bacterium]